LAKKKKDAPEEAPLKSSASTSARHLPASILEWLALLAACWIFASTLPPDVGESHYLCKAKRFWDESYCRGDLFLDSPAPHWLFYVTVGWLTKFCSLEATALISRAVAFAWLAFAWQRLSWAVFDRRWISLLTGGLWLLGLHRLHLAGEWVVGGIEAKSFAYSCLFLGLANLARGTWPKVWLWFGAAAAFHVIVGGWAVVAAGVPLVLRLKKDGWKTSAIEIACLVLGGLIALVGVIPGLSMNSGASPDEARQGHIIYTYVRLGHHLPFHRFEHLYMVRHGLFIVLAIALMATRKRSEPEGRVEWWCWGTLAIALCGVAIDQLDSRLISLAGRASLLRFYFFRLSDMSVPLLVAIEITARCLNTLESQSTSRGTRQAWLLLAIVFAFGHLAFTAYEHRAWPIPPAIRPVALPVMGSPAIVDVQADGDIDAPAAIVGRKADLAATQKWWRDMRTLGAWAKSETDPDDLFLTPPSQQVFKWYASRPEVGTWKDIPQDARGLIEWHKRMHDLIASEEAAVSPEMPTDERLVALARKYNARFIVIDRTRDPTPPRAPRVYPPVMTSDTTFAVYEVKPLAKSKSKSGPDTEPR
jgi:hypothetical protein